MAQVQLNEIMAVNRSYGTDVQGEADDWIELYNAGSASVDLSGYYLSDDPADPLKWQFSQTSSSLTRISGHGFLLVWADGDIEAQGLHAGFSLSIVGETLILSDTKGEMVDRITYEPSRVDVSYGRDAMNETHWGVMAFPTPGNKNMPALFGIAPAPAMDQASGFYEEPFSVALTDGAQDMDVRYTLDGSHPGTSTTALAYSQPISIVRTTCVRVIAQSPGYLPSDVVTRTYLFLQDVINQSKNPAGFPSRWKSVTADYEMDPDIVDNAQYRNQLHDALLSLPTLSIVTDVDNLFGNQGIYANSGSRGVAWERPCAVELIQPDGSDGFQINCGIRIQGGYFRSPNSSRKHSFRLLFKSIYGESKLRYPLFGEDATDEFDTITLRAGANDGYAWNSARNTEQYTRDEFARRLQRDAGQAASHGMYAHLYVNGLYWGLYNPVERPDGAFSASYYGGEKEDWDVFSHKGFSVNQGDRSSLNQMLSTCQMAALSFDNYMRLQGKNPDGTHNPQFPCLLDVPNYIDYMIVNYWGGNWDWPWNNYWLARKRTSDSTGFKFYCWDTEDIMLSPRSPLNFNKITNPDTREVGQPHGLLRQNPEYRLQFADRIHRLFFNNGIMTEGVLIQQYADLTDGIEEAMITESARWGDMHHSSPQTQANWRAMRNQLLTSYLPQRSAIVLQQFKTVGLYPTVDAPVFFVNGTAQKDVTCPVNSLLTMQASSGSAIWFTLGGTDPRVPGSDSQSNVEVTTLFTEDANKRIVVPTGPVDDAWQGGETFDDTSWMSGTGGVGYENGGDYQNYYSMDLGNQMFQGNTSCYIRIPFEVTPDVVNSEDLSLFVRYDDGFVAYLNGEEVARANAPQTLSWNASASTQHSDGEAKSWSQFDISANLDALRTGSNILAIQGLNERLSSSDFLINAYLTSAASSEGPAVSSDVSETAIEWTEPLILTHSLQVNARALKNGKWSALQTAVYNVGPVVENLRITEIMYHPEDPNTEYIELTNAGPESINLNGVQFVDGINFLFGNQPLAAGHFIVVVQDFAAFSAKYGADISVAGQYTGSLSNSGELLELQDVLGRTIEGFTYQDNWHAQADGKGLCLTRLNGDKDPNTPDAWVAAWPNPGSE